MKRDDLESHGPLERGVELVRLLAVRILEVPAPLLSRHLHPHRIARDIPDVPVARPAEIEHGEEQDEGHRRPSDFEPSVAADVLRLRLLAPAADVLRGEKRVTRKVREVKRQKQAAGGELFDRLRTLRKQLADRDGVPPYVVFSDSTLREITELLPETDAQMLAVKGVGQAKLIKYGSPFLEAVRVYVADR